MSQDTSNRDARGGECQQPEEEGTKPTFFLEVNAAYNREGLPRTAPNAPNGGHVLNLDMLLNHPFYWDWLNERETEEVLMEVYLARTRRTQ